MLPAEAVDDFSRRHPELGPDQVDLVERGLLEWYGLVQRAGSRATVIPLIIVSDLWPEHTARSAGYATFCKRCFGRIRQHLPPQVHDVAATADVAYRELLRDTWHLANTSRESCGLSLLFSIDERLAIPGGRRYVEDCGSEPCSAARAFCYRHLPVRTDDSYSCRE